MKDEPIRVFIYKVKSGDTLANIANKFNTDANTLNYLNPNVNFNELHEGQSIFISYFPKVINDPKQNLKNSCRLVWKHHLEYTRMTIISIVDDLNDKDFITEKLLETPKEIKELLCGYYKEKADEIEALLTKHLNVTFDLITAIKLSKYPEVRKIEAYWLRNSRKFIEFICELNPYLTHADLKKLFYSYMTLTKSMIIARVNKEYKKDIECYEKIEEQLLNFADELAIGFIRQFPQEF